MMKRFVSNALLSLVMDKSAREKLQRRNEAKAAAHDGASKSPTQRQSPEPHPDLPARAIRTRSPAAEPAAATPAAARAADVDDPLAVIEDAISEARRSLGMDPPVPGRTEIDTARRAAKAHPAGKTSMSADDREALIAKALSIHAQKSQMLDELDSDARDKLRLMAIKALDPKAFEEIKSEALGERPRKRKR